AAGSRNRCGGCAGREEITMSTSNNLGGPPSNAGGYQLPREHYLNATYGIRSWLLTTDHKRIALLYLVSVTFFFFIGGTFASLIRIELLTPAGDLVQADTYNKLFSIYGQVMIFFFLIPSL